MSLLPLLRPRSIAVVGASPRSFIGQIALTNCRGLGFDGDILPVTPGHSEVGGLRASPRLAALDCVPDVALIQVRTDKVAAVVEEGLHIGIRGFVIPGGGYTDSGSDALDLSGRLAELRRLHQFEVIGPNCMGVVDFVTGAAPYVGTVPAQARRGNVGVVAQSGAIIEAIVNSGGRVPISTAVSSGNESITSLARIFDFFVDDTETTSVLAFVETVSDAAETLSAARRLGEVGKNLAVCVVGRSENARDGIAAHSGKLASGARVTAAAFRQVGAIIGDDLDELISIGELFGSNRTLPRGPRVHIVTNSGGEGNMIADIAYDVGLNLPPVSEVGAAALRRKWPLFHVRNPLDPWGVDDYAAVYPTAIQQAADETGDILVVSIDQQQTSGEHEKMLGFDLAKYLDDATRETAKFPMMLSPTSQDPDNRLLEFCRSRDIPLLRGARSALSALAKVSTGDEASAAAPVQTTPAHSLDGVVTEDQAISALAGLGVDAPRCVRVRSADEAVQAALTMGVPIVLKGCAAGLLHKTELGLVQAGLSDPLIVRLEAERMIAWAAGTGVDLELLVAEMIRGDLELIVGYKRDPVFGPTTLVGLGGVWTEFFDEVAVHVGPVDRAAAARLVDQSRVGEMIARSRGGRLHLDGVLTAICAVSALGSANPDVVGIDINPLIVGTNHATAVDAVVERAHIPQLV